MILTWMPKTCDSFTCEYICPSPWQIASTTRQQLAQAGAPLLLGANSLFVMVVVMVRSATYSVITTVRKSLKFAAGFRTR